MTLRELLRTLDPDRPQTVAELAELLDQPAWKVRERLRGLRDDGLAVSARDGWRLSVPVGGPVVRWVLLIDRFVAGWAEQDRYGPASPTVRTLTEVRCRLLRLADDPEELGWWLHDRPRLLRERPVLFSARCAHYPAWLIRQLVAELLTDLAAADQPAAALAAAVQELVVAAAVQELTEVPW